MLKALLMSYGILYISVTTYVKSMTNVLWDPLYLGNYIC
ncbi:unnamed protein product [Larinioides sclopetarius]|uniref:Uncharacterized protein n=1 Tax=Larinioides sclopetarius TaxID=280406 RepID=A0AAV2AW34_9ARAC